MQPERLTDRNRMTHSRLGFIRCHHHDFPDIPDRFHQASDTRSGDAIIIGNQDDRFFFYPCIFFAFFRMGYGFLFHRIQKSLFFPGYPSRLKRKDLENLK